MQRSSRLQAIVRVQQHREQQQRAVLLDARQQLDKQRQLLQQLESYRSEYLGVNTAVASQPSLAALRNRSRFVGDLSHAIEQQRAREQQVAGQWERENLRWQQQVARGEAMQRLVQQYRDQELRVFEQNEDREAEDHWVATHCR